MRLMNSPDELTGPINIGNPAEATILQLAEKIIALTGSKSEIVFRPLPEHDPKRRQPDLTLAREKLGYAPKVDWDEGLARTVDYFRELLGTGNLTRIQRGGTERSVAA